MSCTATSRYLTLLPYHHNESKSNIQDKFIDNLFKSYNGSSLKFWKPFILTMPHFTKNYIPAVLKDTEEIIMQYIILTAHKS